MIRSVFLLLGLLTLPVLSADVKVLDVVWRDASRNREVPVRIHYDRALTTPAPVVIFSHGLGGSREGYGYLGNAWAAAGIVSVHPQHAGSDAAVWKNGGGLTEAVSGLKALENAEARALDVKFVIDRLEAANREDGELKGRLNMNALGVAGHSFGAQTTLLCAGMKMGGRSFADPRIKAAIAMSPQPPVAGERAFGDVRIPVFHMTGTLDDSPIPGRPVPPADRLKPYGWIQGSDQALLVFEGGDHMVFSGRMAAKRPTDPPMQAQIVSSSIAWWKGRLTGDAASSKWLTEKFPGELGKLGRFEFRPKP